MRRSKFAVVTAAAAPDTDVWQGLSSPVESTQNVLPADVQLFPPGTHQINATKNGKPSAITVTVDKKAAEAVRADFLELTKAADAKKGPRPYLDFNHEDRAASAWVTDVYWAGEDPTTGGIRAKVEWSKPGGEAIVGKEFRLFSPMFRVSTQTGEIIGTTANMGGLVNRAAFREITPFFAKDSGNGSAETNKRTKAPMNKLLQALVAAGLCSAVHENEDAAVIDFNGKWSTVQAKLGKLDASERTATEASQSLTVVTKERDELRKSHETLAGAHADTVLAKWVELGVLPAKDEAAKTLWRGLLVKDAGNEHLMDGVIAAKSATAGTDLTKKVVTSQGQGTQTTNGTTEHEFIVKAKQIAVDRKLSDAEAMEICARTHSGLYNDYRTHVMGGK